MFVIWFKRILVGAAIVLSLLGCILSTQMLVEHSFGTSAGGLLEALCGAGGGGCDKVAGSRWSVFPPYPRVADAEVRAEAAQPTASQPSASTGGVRIPVPVLGLFYFSALATWFVGIGCPNRLGRRWQLVPFLAVLAGNAWSLFFIYIMGWVLKSWCPGCLAVHTINVLLLIIVIATCPRRLRKADIGQPETGPPTGRSLWELVPHPSGRLAMVTIALMLSLWLIGGVAVAALAYKVQVLATTEVVDEVSKDPDLLAAMYFKRARHEIPTRLDDPSRGGPSDAPATLVVFSDMTCVMCKKLETFVVEQIQPQFGDRLQVVFKHYPLSGTCNPHAKERRFPYSCTAARAAEAARRQGGSDSFWRMHDQIRAMSDDLTSVDYPATAKRFGLDPDQFVMDMQGTVVRDRIREDVDLAHKLGVESTPAVFFNGRAVPRVAQYKTDFWKLMAARLTGLKPGTAPAISTVSSAANEDHNAGPQSGGKPGQ